MCTLHFIRLVLPVRNNITVLTCACQSSFLQKPGVLRICSCSAYSILISPIVTLHFLIPSSLFEGTAKKYLDASTSYLCIFERFFFFWTSVLKRSSSLGREKQAGKGHAYVVPTVPAPVAIVGIRPQSPGEHPVNCGRDCRFMSEYNLYD